MDPDGGANLAKKKKKLGALDEVDPELNEKFPCYGFQCSISELPRIFFGHIFFESTRTRLTHNAVWEIYIPRHLQAGIALARTNPKRTEQEMEEMAVTYQSV